MATRLFLGLTLAFLFVAGARSITVTFTNNCPYTVWPATQRGDRLPQLSTTGFELPTGASKPVTVDAPWSGRFWGRTGCTTDACGQFWCATADCASRQVGCNGAGGIPPASLVEFTLAPNGGQDFYDISLVDGFNVPIAVAPQGGTGDCPALTCAGNVNDVCPCELAVAGSDGRVIACKSACEAFGKPEYCCTGAYSKPETCRPTNYSKIFKDKCPQAYSYAYDDKSNLFTCSNGPNYLVTFCP